MHPNSTIAPSAHTHTRRDLLRAAPITALALTVPAAAFSRSIPDAAIIDAWERRLAGYDLINSGVLVEDSLEDQACWTSIDAAEMEIRECTARTPRGAEIQLWTALYHMIDADVGADDLAMIRGDLAYFDDKEKRLDWNARLAFAAIRSLRSIGSH